MSENIGYTKELILNERMNHIHLKRNLLQNRIKFIEKLRSYGVVNWDESKPLLVIWASCDVLCEIFKDNPIYYDYSENDLVSFNYEFDIMMKAIDNILMKCVYSGIYTDFL